MIVIHRHTFRSAEILAALLPEAGQHLAHEIRIDAGQLVIDIIGPGEETPAAPPEPSATNETAKSDVAPAEPEEPELKGGPFARRASICCGEKGFWTFLGVESAEAAKADVCRRCGVTSRRFLDHNEAAALRWREIDRRYGLWLEGYDVEVE